MDSVIQLSSRKYPGLATVIDESDHDLVSGLKWHPLHSHGNVYAYAHRMEGGRRRTLLLHTLITGWPMVDHEDGDGLNNRRSNLRESDFLTNRHNTQSRSGSTSQYLGVRLRNGRWYAAIKSRHIGVFDDEMLAARAFDAVASEQYGSFASLNFPLEMV